MTDKTRRREIDNLMIADFKNPARMAREVTITLPLEVLCDVAGLTEMMAMTLKPKPKLRGHIDQFTNAIERGAYPEMFD